MAIKTLSTDSELIIKIILKCVLFPNTRMVNTEK